MASTTARALLWTAGILAVLGAMIGSPAGGVLAIGLGALLAALAAIPPGRRTRILAAVLTLASLALAGARLGEARREMARHRASAARTAR